MTEQLEKQALNYWRNKQYDKCLNSLINLEKKNSDNIRVIFYLIDFLFM